MSSFPGRASIEARVLSTERAIRWRVKWFRTKRRLRTVPDVVLYYLPSALFLSAGVVVVWALYLVWSL